MSGMDMSQTMDMAQSMASMSAAMKTMSMDMASMISATASAAAAAATTTMDHAAHASATAASMTMDMGASMSMPMASATAAAGGHSGMSMGNNCKISMLWNWNTIDACFISSDWQITNGGMFAGTCIGVFFWVIAICLVQRLHREFDRYIYRQWAEKNGVVGACVPTNVDRDSSMSSPIKGKFASFVAKAGPTSTVFRPNIWQQFIRACLFTLEFGAGYLLMLMAMYYNGYILITMWLGALFGYFFLGGDTANGFGSILQKSTCC